MKNSAVHASLCPVVKRKNVLAIEKLIWTKLKRFCLELQ